MTMTGHAAKQQNVVSEDAGTWRCKQDNISHLGVGKWRLSASSFVVVSPHVCRIRCRSTRVSLNGGLASAVSALAQAVAVAEHRGVVVDCDVVR